MLATRARAAGLPASKSFSSWSENTGENPFLLPPHWRCCALCRFRMLVAEHVQGSVDDEAQNLFARRDALSLCIRTGDFRADVDVADYRTAPTLSSEPEGDHIG